MIQKNKSATSEKLKEKYLKSLSEDERSLAFAPLAEYYRGQNQHLKAFELLKKGLKFNPNYQLGVLTLAKVYRDQKKYQLGHELLSSFYSSQQDNMMFLGLYAELSEKTGNIEDALLAYEQILFLNPRDKHSKHKIQVIKKNQDRENKLGEKTIFIDSASVKDAEIEQIKNQDEDSWIQLDTTHKVEQKALQKKRALDLSPNEQKVLNKTLDDSEDGFLVSDIKQIHAHIQKKEALEKKKADFLKEESRALKEEMAKRFLKTNETLNENLSPALKEPKKEEIIESTQVDDSTITKNEEAKAKERPRVSKSSKSSSSSFITLSLIEVYIAQGHLKKALDFCYRLQENLIEKNDQNELKKVEAKIEELSEKLSIHDEPSMIDQIGQHKLSALLDRVSKKQERRKDPVKYVKTTFDDFLSEIKSQAKEFSL